MKLNLGRDSEGRFGQHFEFQVYWDAEVWSRFGSWCLVDILEMNFNQDLYLNSYFGKLNSTNVLVMALVEALVAPKLDVAVDKNKWDLWQLTRTPLILNKGFWKQSIAWGRRWMPLTRMPGAFQLEISNVSIFTCFFKAFWPSTPWLLLRARKKSLVMPSKKCHCHQKCEWQNN